MFPNWIKEIIIYKKKAIQNMNTKKKGVGFNININKHGFLSHYNMREDPLFGIFYVAVKRIPCSN